MEQLDLFQENNFNNRKSKLGQTEIDYKPASSILTKASGFMADYDYTLNPYSGCSFGCTYCYAAFFTRNKEKMDNWGKWLTVKENALQILKKKRKKPLIDKTIYLSSVTDPYQPIEKDLELTRSILKELVDFHKVRLVIQTRSTMVTRDIDLFKKFEAIQVNMTVTTDSEKVRKVFEPFCPGNKHRIEAIEEVSRAGVQSCITMTPLLPIENPTDFAEKLLSTGINKFIIQPFHKDKGKFVAGTRSEAMQILNDYNWNDQEYQRVLKIMREKIPNLGIGKTGFAPI
jgi:DNA repair photolyase